MSLFISTGPTWLQNDKTIWSVPFSANRIKVGHDKSYYSYSTSVSPQVRYALNKELSAAVSVSLSKRHYNDFSERNSFSKSISPSISWQFMDETNLGFGVNIGSEDADLDVVSNDYWSINGSVFHRVSKNISVSFNGSFTDAGYEDKEIAYTKKRHDKTVRASLNLIYHVAPIATELVLSGVLTINNSNLELYDYDREQLSLSIRKAF